MKKILFLVLTVVAVFFVNPVSADTLYMADISGAQETPDPIDTPAVGLAVLSLNADETQLTVVVNGFNIDATASHIHRAPAGESGPVVFSIGTGYPTPQVRVWAIPADMVEALKNGELYVNLHTTQYPGGEIRGQVSPVQVP
ncbi:MAG: CHRD domain-containing protein [Acidobacteria bacterium]|nr:CHRD domain-containing protein [Acidobacteriota bacterium]MBI3658026.1 CHRD domain-containing protein [Acidobacteriota bacterium]